MGGRSRRRRLYCFRHNAHVPHVPIDFVRLKLQGPLGGYSLQGCQGLAINSPRGELRSLSSLLQVYCISCFVTPGICKYSCQNPCSSQLGACNLDLGGARGKDRELDAAAPVLLVKDPGAVLLVRLFQKALRVGVRVCRHRLRNDPPARNRA